MWGAEVMFQFHKGSIRTTMCITNDRAVKSFNSIKVQLELAQAKANGFSPNGFNSIKVQLELAKRIFCVTLIGVSIP